MSLLIKDFIKKELLSPEEIAGKSMGIEDMVSFMGRDKTPDLKDTPPKVDDKVDDEEEIKLEIPDEEIDEDKIDLDKKPEDEIEDDEEDEITDDKLELLDHTPRKEILKEYPDLFKKFPYLEHAYYRNLQFTELFSKPEEAKAAIEAQQTLQNFESELLNGDQENILRAVKEENEESFHKLVDNYLGTLEKVDPKMWEHVVGNLNKQTIYAMYKEGKSSDNKDMMKAALMLNQFIFGTSEYTPPVQLSKKVEKTDKEKELEEKEKSFNEKQLNTHKTSLQTRVDNSIRNTIELNIDPKGSLTNQFVKDKAIEDAMTSLDKLMKSDNKYVKNLALLWNEAAKNNYDQSSLDKIKSAQINKARTLLRGVIKDTRNKVFKGSSNSNKVDVGSRKGPVSQGKPATPNSGKSKDSEIKPGETSLEYMNRMANA